MQNEFISIGKFIDNICKTVQANNLKGVVGYILRKYDLFDISLYQKSKNDKEIILANAITTELIYDYMRETYPPKPKYKTTSYKEITSALLTFSITKTPFDLNFYLWKAEDFYQKSKDFNQLFNDMPVERIAIPPNLESLNRTITELKQDVSNKDDEITRLKARIAELEAKNTQLSTTITTNNEFSLLFDKNHECFAPDLVYAIRLWNDIYANDQKKKDSHTNLANTWIEKHTQYNKHAQGCEQAKGRIREITTPLKDFGAKRLKEK